MTNTTAASAGDSGPPRRRRCQAPGALSHALRTEFDGRPLTRRQDRRFVIAGSPTS